MAALKNAFWTYSGDPVLTKKYGKSGLFGTNPKTPEITPPTVMPDTDEEAVKAARRRQIAEVQTRSGRASTILSQSDKLGG